MTSLIYLTTISPSKLGDELTLAGYRVFEARALSEALCLQEQENIGVVLIDSSVEQPLERTRQLRGIIFTLKPEATSAYVQWELSLLFSNGDMPLRQKAPAMEG